MAVYSPLASAAGGARNPFGASDPFGLSGNSSHGIGYSGSQLLNQPQQPAGQKTPTGQTPVIPLPTNQATTPGAAGAPTPNAGQFQFDLKTDPALQQVNALTGLSDEQANAQALQERQQMLLAYGDPTLAASILGQGDPTVTAAGQNQESQLSMLGRQKDQNLLDFEKQLDPSLTFSGYKVGQEKQLGQQYQDALAQAAAGVQQGLGGITSNLNQALQQNQMQRENAAQAAYANELQMILAGLGSGGNSPPAPAGPTDGTYSQPTSNVAAAGGLPGSAGAGGYVQPRAIGGPGSFWSTLLGGGTPTSPTPRFS